MADHHHHHHHHFPPDQAAILQDIARHGAPSRAHMQAQSIGSATQDFAFSDTYADEMDDTVSLLESLANYQHNPEPEPDPDTRPPVSNDAGNHFASLLEAAATAEGSDRSKLRRSNTKRKRNDGVRDEIVKQADEGHKAKPLKRAKSIRTPRVDDEEQLAREREIWGPPEPAHEEREHEMEQSTNASRHSPVAPADARALGVQSAAALFRRPSAASKKYTRPPMSKLFTSLELTPEDFLHLQAAAKSYMLDANYPERSDCVGSKGAGDTDMVKLKLFACVKSFLEDEGWGERCFGEHAPGAEIRRLRWPQMQNKIISLITPLLRRMVTNERQRLYAMEARHEKSKAGTKQSTSSEPIHGTELPAKASRRPKPPERQTLSPGPDIDIDPKLKDYHYNIDPSIRDLQTAAAHSNQPAVETSVDADTGPTLAIGVTPITSPTDAQCATTTSAPESSVVMYHINIMRSGRRIKPKLSLSPLACPGFSSLVQFIHNMIDGDQGLDSIKILSPRGLVAIEDEDGWKEVIATIEDTEWMEGEVKCVVQIEDS